MSITTKRGDEGKTDLLGSRVPKDHMLIEIIGVLDELNAEIGISINHIRDQKLKSILRHIQEQLFILGSEVASIPAKNRDKLPHITERDLRFIENTAQDLEDELPPLKNFILPGGSEGGSVLHSVRAIARRGERRVLMAAKKHPDLTRVVPYVNRLSDLLFHMARKVNMIDGAEEIIWKS